MRKNCAVGIWTKESIPFTYNIGRIIGPLAIFVLLGNGTDVVDWFKSMTVTSKRSINIFYKYILVQSVPDSDLERIDPQGRDAFDHPFPVGSNSENIPIG